MKEDKSILERLESIEKMLNSTIKDKSNAIESTSRALKLTRELNKLSSDIFFTAFMVVFCCFLFLPIFFVVYSIYIELNMATTERTLVKLIALFCIIFITYVFSYSTIKTRKSMFIKKEELEKEIKSLL